MLSGSYMGSVVEGETMRSDDNPEQELLMNSLPEDVEASLGTQAKKNPQQHIRICGEPQEN